jgi:hypothetical protein
MAALRKGSLWSSCENVPLVLTPSCDVSNVFRAMHLIWYTDGCEIAGMKRKKISKARMAVLLRTSRTQVDRLLNPETDITISSLQRAAAMVGRRVMIELV